MDQHLDHVDYKETCLMFIHIEQSKRKQKTKLLLKLKTHLLITIKTIYTYVLCTFTPNDNKEMSFYVHTAYVLEKKGQKFLGLDRIY